MSGHKSTFLLFLLAMGAQAFASSRLTVAELQQKLAADRSKTDTELAQQLTDVELTERISANTLAALTALAPGTKSSQELRILADQSVFLPLPPAEIPAMATPDAATQRQLMGRVVNYVTRTIHLLPNFYANRSTTHFEETPQRQGVVGTAAIQYVPLHQTATQEETVLYRNGQEIVDNGTKVVNASAEQAKGLRNWGAFGAILSTVLLDAARSDLSWSHWEQAATGTRAVFRYAVPEAKSHYRVTYCCVPEADPRSGLMRPFDRVAGYHGEIAVDPQEGSILRVTVQADLKPADPVSMANIMVEYGTVEIGGQTYICPIRSVSLSTALSAPSFHGDVNLGGMVTPGPPQKLLNDVAFDHYHVFRSDVRLANGDQAPTPAAGTEQAAAATAATATQEPEHVTETVAVPSPVASAVLTPPTPTAAETLEPPVEKPVFRTTTRDVIVDVAVTRGNGDPVPGLGKDDFEVRENGKPQSIDFFDPHTQSSTNPVTSLEMPALPAGSFTNVSSAPATGVANVLLVDTLNTQLPDQAYVRRQILDLLAKLEPGSRIAIFVLGSQLRYLQGFTSNTATLQAAIRDPRSGLKGEKNTALKTSGDRATDAAETATMETMQMSMQAIDAVKAALGDVDARNVQSRTSMTVEALTYLGYYLAGVPGRKNLIWFAGSFPFAIFPTAEQLAYIKHNPALSAYANRIRTIADLFTAARVAVYPISAEGLMTEHVAEADTAGPGAAGGVGHGGSQADSAMSPYNQGANERAAAVEPMEQLAASTGGKAYYNTNDLGTALNRALRDGANYYTIGYRPADSSMDGRYREIAVRLTHGNLKLAYRRGYYADNTPMQAASSPADPLSPLLRLGLPGTGGVLYGAHAVRATVQPSAGEAHAGQNAGLQDPVTRYTVNFVIRAQDLLLNPNPGEASSSKFLLGLKAYDGSGVALNWAADKQTVEVKADQYASVRENGIPAQLEIDLPSANDIQLVTAVYNLDSGKAGTLEIPLDRVNPQ